MSRRILLLEPNYKNKYPPIGLMKLATYYKKIGDDVRFYKGNLKDFAAELLCEEFILSINVNHINKYFNKIKKYIRTGQKNELDAIEPMNNEVEDKLLLYRKKYREKDFPRFDIICITTLFTFYWKETIETIEFSKHLCSDKSKIYVGGVTATLLSSEIYRETGINSITGLLNKSGILDENDIIIDNLPLDYSILDEIDYDYPAGNAYLSYMTRGCPRKCSFCAVPKLEPIYCGYISLKEQLVITNDKYGEKKNLLLMDNNVFASDSYDQIIDEIKEVGYGKNAYFVPQNEYLLAINNLRNGINDRAYIKKIIKIYNNVSEKLNEVEQGKLYIKRENRGLLFPSTSSKTEILDFDKEVNEIMVKHMRISKSKRYVDFNQGVDARLVTEAKIKKLSELNIKPLRIAFDHYSMKDQYEKAIRLAAKYEINNLSNYLLYNFLDKPEELYYRMKLNVELCEELNVSIYSFPMKYHPIDDPKYFDNRDYIGKHWNKKFIRAIQSVLNSTKGKIGRSKSFFDVAFGKDIDEFNKILWMPEKYIIYRNEYKDNLTKEWWDKFVSLDQISLGFIKDIISRNKFDVDEKLVDNKVILDILNFYKV